MTDFLQAGATFIQGEVGTSRAMLSVSDRTPTDDQILKNLWDNIKADVHKVLPAIVISFNPATQTIAAQPTIPDKFIDRLSGNSFWTSPPPILDIPVVFPGGGNYVTTWPIQPGDEVLLLMADQCIDSWFTSGGGPWQDKRRHDLSDAIAIPGLRNQTRVIPDFNTTGSEFRQVIATTPLGPAKITEDTMVLVSNDVPVTYAHLKMEANGASVECTMTNVTITVDGVPVQVPTPTVALIGNVTVNGAGIGGA